MSGGLAPPDFTWEPVFCDIRYAKHTLTIDLTGSDRPHAMVHSTVTFKVANRGQPIIDLSHSNAIRSAKIGPETGENEPTGFGRIESPDGQTSYLVFGTVVEAGINYELEVEQRLDLARPGNDAEICFFRMSHAKHFRQRSTDRLYLERYLPSNLEYDQHAMRLVVNVIGQDPDDLLLVTNGQPQNIGLPWTILFASDYTCSCPFFFLGWKAQLELQDRDVETGGDPVPVQLFCQKDRWSADELTAVWNEVEEKLEELHTLYGSFPHMGLKLYLGDHGIEYAGAAEISRSNVHHELVHQYFGRCVLPRDGDAGWIDEAIAHWAVMGYRRISTPPDRKSNMGGVSAYRRATDLRARSLGAMVLGHFDHLIHEATSHGSPIGFRAFLRWWFNERRWMTVTSEVFENDLVGWIKTNVDPALEDEIRRLFEVYVYGTRELGE